ncbi:glycosyltransferase [Puteibacter caeruleilacunae]|nr:glycosyltransferase [Puteibacter caeruleilacunae]
MKRRIVIIGPAYPYRGGISALNERLARQLEDEGHEVSIWNFKLQYPEFLFPGKSQFTDSETIPGLKIKRLINSINPFNWIKIGLKLKKEKPDYVIVRFWLPFMGPSTGTICKIARQNKHTKIIGLIDNIIPHEKKPGDRLLTKYFTSSLHGFVAMSDTVYQDISLFTTKKPKVMCPHPIYDHYGEVITREQALKNLQLDPQYQYLLFFGFIRDYKGLDLLLKAFANPRLAKYNLRLLVAGEFYSNEEKYLDIIERFQLQDKIILRNDYIPNEEINNYFCAADLVVQPYKSATQSGITQIGYHFNKPMLVTNVGGLSEIIAHDVAGYVINPDELDIANAIIDFFQNERKEEFEEAVPVEKKKFSWERMTETLEEMYQSIK